MQAASMSQQPPLEAGMSEMYVYSDRNPTRVELQRSLTGVKKIKLRYMRIALPNFSGIIPRFFFVNAKTPSNFPGRSTFINASTNVRIPEGAVPVHLRTNPTIFAGAPAQYPILFGFQDANCTFQMDNVGDLTVFDLELIDGDTGTPLVFPVGSQILYSFTVYSIPSKSTVNTTTVSAVRRLNDYLDA